MCSGTWCCEFCRHGAHFAATSTPSYGVERQRHVVAAQVLGVKEYLEKLQAKQTFYKNPVGNAKVAKSGHVYAKVKFGDFTKEAYDDWRKKGGKPPNNNEEGRSANHWF